MGILRAALLGVLLIVISQAVYGQKGFDFVAGIGYYELTHVGVNWNFSSKSSLGFYGGTNFNLRDSRLRCVGLSYKHIYINPLFWKIRAGFSLAPQYWIQEDENYYYSNVAFMIQCILNYPINQRLSLNLESGGVFNSVLETERKQNTTLGSPVRWNGNVAVSIRYRLKNKTNSQ